ncbi:unnamed protein product [Pleuronectes platessa]|uniref:Uncharacterized protein n=1 Tax=Pleuronectes platessa TaxID=8262 RepID=A0A9N7YAF7_PLEPL|nr:unnamed protein product [Pleuronectes platessa]
MCFSPQTIQCFIDQVLMTFLGICCLAFACQTLRLPRCCRRHCCLCFFDQTGVDLGSGACATVEFRPGEEEEEEKEGGRRGGEEEGMPDLNCFGDEPKNKRREKDYMWTENSPGSPRSPLLSPLLGSSPHTHTPVILGTSHRFTVFPS